MRGYLTILPLMAVLGTVMALEHQCPNLRFPSRQMAGSFGNLVCDTYQNWCDNMKVRNFRPTERQNSWWKSLGVDQFYKSSAGDRKENSRQKREAEDESSKSMRKERKEYRMLSDEERTRFHKAVRELKRKTVDGVSLYDLFTGYHQAKMSPGAYYGPAFLPWHREYLLRFENALKSVDPSVSLPFWASTLDLGLGADAVNSVTWSRGFLGNGIGPVVTGPFAGWSLAYDSRGLNRLFRNVSVEQPSTDVFPRLLDDDAVRSFRDSNSYRDITWYVNSAPEGYHDSALSWVGGIMSDLPNAPSDPTYFLHLAFIDCLWEGMRSNQRSRGVDPRWDYPNDTVALGVGQRQPNGQVLSRSDDSSHYALGSMYPFSPLRNIDGMSDIYTDQYYSCASVPACSQGSLDCGSPYLFCDVRTYRCAPKLRLGAMCTSFEAAPADTETNPCYDSSCCNGVCTRQCPMGVGARAQGALPRPASATTPSPNYQDNQQRPSVVQQTQDIVQKESMEEDDSQETEPTVEKEQEAEVPETRVRETLDTQEPNPFIHPDLDRQENPSYERPPWFRRNFRRRFPGRRRFRPRFRGYGPPSGSRSTETQQQPSSAEDERTPSPTPSARDYEFRGPRLPFGPLPKDDLYPRNHVTVSSQESDEYSQERKSEDSKEVEYRGREFLEQGYRNEDADGKSGHQIDPRGEVKELMHELFRPRPTEGYPEHEDQIKVTQGLYRPTRPRSNYRPRSRFVHVDSREEHVDEKRSHDAEEALIPRARAPDFPTPDYPTPDYPARPHSRYEQLYGRQISEQLRSFSDRNFDEQSLVRYVLFADRVNFKYKEPEKAKESIVTNNAEPELPVTVDAEEVQEEQGDELQAEPEQAVPVQAEEKQTGGGDSETVHQLPAYGEDQLARLAPFPKHYPRLGAVPRANGNRGGAYVQGGRVKPGEKEEEEEEEMKEEYTKPQEDNREEPGHRNPDMIYQRRRPSDYWRRPSSGREGPRRPQIDDGEQGRQEEAQDTAESIDKVKTDELFNRRFYYRAPPHRRHFIQ